MSSARKPTKRSAASANAADLPATTAAPAAPGATPADQPPRLPGMTNDELGATAGPQTLLIELAPGSTAANAACRWRR
jgi:hypothetical protein